MPPLCGRAVDDSLNSYLDVYTVTKLYATFLYHYQADARYDHGKSAAPVPGSAGSKPSPKDTCRAARSPDRKTPSRETPLGSAGSRSLPKGDSGRTRQPVQGGGAAVLHGGYTGVSKRSPRGSVLPRRGAAGARTGGAVHRRSGSIRTPATHPARQNRGGILLAIR